jgi:N-acetylglucosaminyl-diphospho-decaprenol L-rhamnosyltransferase
MPPSSLGLSVIIPHHGDAGQTLKLVRALKSQRTSCVVQIIVSDDCSPARFPETQGVRLTRRESNGGFGSAVNAGAALAEHDLLLVLNSDVEIEDTFVDDLMSAAAPWMPAVVSPWVISPDGHAAWTGRHFPRARHQFVEWLVPLARWRDRPALHEAVGHDTRAVESVTTAVDWVVGAAMLLPTDEFLAVGGFDERFFMNSEEVDLQRRLRQRGLPSVVLGSPTLLHEGGGSSSDSARRRGWLVRSRLEYAGKWGGRRRLTTALVVATAVNLVWNSGRRLLGRPVHPWATARHELSMLDREKQS